MSGPGDRQPSVTLAARRWVESRPVVLVAAAVGFGAIFALRQGIDSQYGAIALLYVIPVSLVALELGLAAGIAGALFAEALVGLWELTSGIDIGALGLITRGIAFLAVGLLGGRFSQVMRQVNTRQHGLLGSGLALAHIGATDDIADMLVHHVARLLPVRNVRATLGDDHATVGQDGIGRSAETFPIESRGVRSGTLEVVPVRPLDDEDRAVLSTILLQAAVADENRRLLEVERQRARIEAELDDARHDLAHRGVQLQALFSHQEAERDRVAYELHEQCAQMVAAVMLGFKALERDLGPVIATERLQSMRETLQSTLHALRTLALRMRPQALSLGLQTALEGLIDEAPHGRPVQADIELDGLAPMTAETETTVYRIVEELLELAGPARAVSIRSDLDRSCIVIDVIDGEGRPESKRLAVLGARAEMVGGTLSVDDGRLRASVPV